MILFLQIFHGLLLAFTSFSPAPEFYVFPYLASNGLLPYSQIIDQHMPGLLLLPFNLNTLGFTTSQSFHSLYILIILVQSVFIGKLTKSPLAVFFFALLSYAFRATGLWYETFIPLFTLPALYLLLTKKYFWCGIFIGLAVLFKQNAILLIVPILFIARSNFPKLLLGTLLPITILFFYLLSLGVFTDFLFWTGLYNFQSYAHLARQSPSIGFIAIIVICLTVSSAICLTSRNRLYKFAYLIWVFSLPGVFVRFTPLQLQAALPFLAIVLSANSKIKWLAIIPLLMFLRFPNPAHDYLSPEIQNAATYIKQQVKQNDQIFLLGVQPHMYFLTQTLPPDNYFSYHLPWYLKVNELTQLDHLKKRPPKYVVLDTASQIDNITIYTSASRLIDYITVNYYLLAKFDTYEIYAKNN